MSKNNIPTEIQNLLSQAGYTLDTLQPHTLGERFLMQNITMPSGQKYILLGQDSNNQKVVIKVSTDTNGSKELECEKACRELLLSISFSYKSFNAPEINAFWKNEPYTVSVQSYINQSSSFIERSLESQFTYALEALKTQESARATTASHYKTIANTFGVRTSADYLALAENFCSIITSSNASDAIQQTVIEVIDILQRNKNRIEQYCGFLTHTDFVPHNFRINEGAVYLLDCSSLSFGNKHESWARFLNFMTLYNYKLEELLITYIKKNRSAEERESLQLMRLYRLVEIVAYYTKTLEKSDGDLLKLNQARVHFWHEVLMAESKNQRVRRDITESYRITRDALRSNEERLRQKNLH